MPVTDALKLTCATCGQANRVPSARLADSPKCGVCGAVLVGGTVAELDGATHDKVTRGDGHVVHGAETHRERARRVVTRRAGCHKRVL